MARSASFHAVTNLDEIVAVMIRDKHREVALKVEDAAKGFAPPTKRWISLADGNVRDQHVKMHGKEVADNLRFKLDAYAWDIKHHGEMGPLHRGTPGGGRQDRKAQKAPGEHSFLLYPRDQTGGSYVAIVNCRCYLETDPDGIRRLIKTEPTMIVGRKVTTKVVATGVDIDKVERGDEYPRGIAKATGAYFMRKAIAQVAVTTRTRAAVK